jgi:hypothetical protein
MAMASSVKTMRKCAYCGQGSDLTNEHVFPECFRRTFEAVSIAKTPAGEKAILSALEIHDVCARCNAGSLSQLDAYLCTLNDKYFSKIVRPGDRVRFEYDFDLLLRMLLKIGYNVARARKWPLGHWQDTMQYILGNTPCPAGFHVFLQLMIPTPAKKTNLPVSPGTIEVPPWPMSVYPIDMSGHRGLVSGSWVSVWSYRFFVLREDAQVPRGGRRQAIARWAKNTKGAYELTPRGVATIYASSVEVLDSVEDSPIFHEQLSKARRLKSDTELSKSGR